MFEQYVTWFLDALLVFVGLAALAVYRLQKCDKRREAASLVVIQINSLQDSVREIARYTANNQLDNVAFYEALPILNENYWDKYKHLFVRKMDSASFKRINQFYEAVAALSNQQQYIKEMQQNSFRITQRSLATLETQFIAKCIEASCKDLNDKSAKSFIDQFCSQIPDEVKAFFENYTFSAGEKGFDHDLFWKLYRFYQQSILQVINGSAITLYMPLQNQLSISKILDQCLSLEIVGTAGYKMLQKISYVK